MKTLTEIEDYVTTTYKSLMTTPDPVYNGVPRTHPLCLALTETASILAMHTITTPQMVLAALDEAAVRVRDWINTPADYIKSILAAYQQILNYINEGNYPMSTESTEERKARVLAWFKRYAPPKTKIFSYVNTHQNSAGIVDVYLIRMTNEEQEAVWLNRYMRHLGLVTLNSQEHIVEISPSFAPEGIAQELAERLGQAVWEDPKAFTYQRL